MLDELLVSFREVCVFLDFHDGCRGIDFAIANSEIPKKVEDLPSLLKQVSCCILKLKADSGQAKFGF